MDSKTFEAFLKRRKTKNLLVDTNDDWPLKVIEFITNIRDWLTPFEEKGLLTIKEEKMAANETFFYNSENTKRIILQIDSSVSIILEPIGKYKQKRYNRIDMIGPNNTISIVYSKKHKWMFRNTLPVIEYEIITKETFLNAIYHLSNQQKFY